MVVDVSRVKVTDDARHPSNCGANTKARRSPQQSDKAAESSSRDRVRCEITLRFCYPHGSVGILLNHRSGTNRDDSVTIKLVEDTQSFGGSFFTIKDDN